MAEIVENNVRESFLTVLDGTPKRLPAVEDTEETIDFLNKEISSYISSIMSQEENAADAAAMMGEDAAGEPVVGWGLTPLEWRERLAARHIFTHVEWRMTGYLLTVSGDGPREFLWADREALEGLAVPSAFGRFLEKIKEIL